MSMLQDRLFRQAIEQAYGSVLITTAELDLPGPTIVYANAAFCEQSGYTQEELIGQTPRILQGPETDRAVLNRLRTALAQSGAFDGQTINYRKNGTPYRVRWSIRPIRDDQQRITHYISLQSDITDISVTRDELTRQAELLKMAEKTVRFGGWLIELKRIAWNGRISSRKFMVCRMGFRPRSVRRLRFIFLNTVRRFVSGSPPVLSGEYLMTKNYRS